MTSFCGLKVHAKVMYRVCSPCTVVEVTLVSLSSQPHTVINSYSIQDSSHRMVHVNSKIVSDLLATLAWLGCIRETLSVNHTRSVPLFIQPLPLSRRRLDSAVLPSYSCRNLYLHDSRSTLVLRVSVERIM